MRITAIGNILMAVKTGAPWRSSWRSSCLGLRETLHDGRLGIGASRHVPADWKTGDYALTSYSLVVVKGIRHARPSGKHVWHGRMGA